MIIGHQKQWDYLKSSFENEQLSHAFLFCGENQIGKKTLAIELVKLLNCKEKNKPCGVCKNCLDIEKGNFLDFLLVRIGEESTDFEGKFSYNSALPDLKSGEELADKKEIGVDQARKIIDFLSLKSYFNNYKAVIIDNAEKLTTEAQNCLLKTLEEPKSKTVLILVTSQPDRLLTTIFSRCQLIKFFKTKEILEKSVGLPTGREKKKREKEILDELLKIISGSLAEKFAYTKNIKEEGSDVLLMLKILQKHFREKILIDNSVTKKLKLLDELIYKISFTNASPKLALEILLLEI